MPTPSPLARNWPPQVSLAMGLQLMGFVAVWTGIFTHPYFGRSMLLLMGLASIVGVVSQLAYLFVWSNRAMPVVVSFVVALVLVLSYGGIWTASDPLSEKWKIVLMIIKGPFAYGFAWRGFVSPQVLTVAAALALGISFRPSWLSAHLLAVASSYWLVQGFVMAVFASLGT